MKRFYSVVLALTDQYPPQVTGGAELSLHAQIKSTTHHDARVVVVTLDQNIDSVSRDYFEGVEVYRVPFDESWPRFAQQPSRLSRYRVALEEYVEHRRHGDGSYVEKARLITGMYQQGGKGLGILPLFDRQTLCRNEVVQTLQTLIEQIEPDVIHADNYRSIVLAGSLRTRIPIVSSVRDNRFFCAHRNQAMNVDGVICASCEFACVDGKAENGSEALIKKFMAEVMDIRIAALRASAEIVVTSRYLQERVQKIAPSVAVTRIPNITESPRKIAQMTAGIDRARPPEVLCVGMIGHNKGQLQIIQKLEYLERVTPNYRLVFAGRGALTGALQRLLGEQRLRDKVQFTGFLSREELFRCYARASVVVCPNVWPEPFGRVPLEAALARKPVVVFDTGGIAEQVRHAATGYVVEPGNLETLLETIGHLLLDPERAQRLGEAGYEFARARHEDLQPGAMLTELWSKYFR